MPTSRMRRDWTREARQREDAELVEREERLGMAASAQASWSNTSLAAHRVAGAAAGQRHGGRERAVGVQVRVREERDRLRVERVLLVLAVAVSVHVPSGAGKQVKTPSSSVHGVQTVPPRSTCTTTSVKAPRSGSSWSWSSGGVSRVPRTESTRRRRGPAHVGLEEDAVLVVVDVAGRAADVGVLQVGEELDLAEPAVALRGVAAERAGEGRRARDDGARRGGRAHVDRRDRGGELVHDEEPVPVRGERDAARTVVEADRVVHRAAGRGHAVAERRAAAAVAVGRAARARRSS